MFCHVQGPRVLGTKKLGHHCFLTGQAAVEVMSMQLVLYVVGQNGHAHVRDVCTRMKN